jgi:hypothetical protein
MADDDCGTTLNRNNNTDSAQPPTAAPLVRPPSLLPHTPAGMAVGATTTNTKDMIHEDDDVEDDEDRCCRLRTKNNVIVRGQPPTPLRRGKWSQEEEAYSARLIHEFVAGVLPLTHEGTTLRAFLSHTLHCDRMRITKKLADCDSIGKHKFMLRRHGDHPYTAEQLQRKQAELWELERLYLARVNATPTTTVGGVDRLQEQQQLKHKPPPKQQSHRYPHHPKARKIYKISHPTHSREGQQQPQQQQQQQQLLRPLISQAPHEKYPPYYSFPQWTTQQLPHHYYSRQQQQQQPPTQTYAVPLQQQQQQQQQQQHQLPPSPSIHFQQYPYWQQHQSGAVLHEAIATAAEAPLTNPCDRFLQSTSTRPCFPPGGTWHQTMTSTPASTAVENPSPTTTTGVALRLVTAADGHRDCFVHQQQHHMGDSSGMSVDDDMIPNTPKAMVAPCNCKQNCESLLMTTTMMTMTMMRNNNTDSTNTTDGRMIMSPPLRQVFYDREDSLTSMNSADFMETLLSNDDDGGDDDRGDDDGGDDDDDGGDDDDDGGDDDDDGGDDDDDGGDDDDDDDGGVDDDVPSGAVQQHECMSSSNNDNNSSSSSHSHNDTSFELAPMDDDDDDDEIDSLDLSSIGDTDFARTISSSTVNNYNNNDEAVVVLGQYTTAAIAGPNVWRSQQHQPGVSDDGL